MNGESPTRLLMPDKAGTYELRYVLGLGNSNGDDVVSERLEINVQ